MTRKVAICGNGTFPLTTAVGAQIVDVIRDCGEAVFLTRGSGPFEQFVAHVCLTLGLRCFVFKGKGGGDNVQRDAELVAVCDELIAFLDPNSLDNTNTGAARVMERALYLGKPVRAATVVDQVLVWA